eukprot:TRINITY_DN8410_c0_g2_i6.p1 TRINITY_DN8410_c0_g2~~TRINITY_DN8410_c0_g2_i6.p1  ORF type:complete len:668 (+),score=167.92 TRINITY_DN8410_c0_g2_i6:1057-3060(+)
MKIPRTTSLRRKKKIVDWANACLQDSHKPIKNIESLRTGVKIYHLICHFMPHFGDAGEFNLSPKTAVDFLQNADYIVSKLVSLNFAQIPDLTMQGLAVGERLLIVKLLFFVRDKYDISQRYESILGSFADDEFLFDDASQLWDNKRRSVHEKRKSAGATTTSSGSGSGGHGKKGEHRKSVNTKSKSPLQTPSSSPTVVSNGGGGVGISVAPRKNRKSSLSEGSKDFCTSDPSLKNRIPKTTIPKKHSKTKTSTSNAQSDASPTIPTKKGKIEEKVEEKVEEKTEEKVEGKAEEKVLVSAPVPLLSASKRTPEEVQEAKAKKAATMMRQLVAKEILTTEVSYYESLKTLNDKLASLVLNKSILEPEEFKMCFSNVQEMVAIHEVFSTELDALIQNWDDNVMLGEFFVGKAGLVDQYKDYLSNYPVANLSFEQLYIKYPSLQNHCRAYEAFLKSKNGLRLRDVLIMPVQRIPRYIMLFEQLAKYTHPDTEGRKREKELLEKARKTMQEKLLQINSQIERDKEDKMRESWNVYRQITDNNGILTINIQRRLLRKPTAAKILSVEPVVGSTNTNTRKHLAKRKVTLILFTDFLVITQPAKKNKPEKTPSTLGQEDIVYPLLEFGVTSKATVPDLTKPNQLQFEFDQEIFLLLLLNDESILWLGVLAKLPPK